MKFRKILAMYTYIQTFKAKKKNVIDVEMKLAEGRGKSIEHLTFPLLSKYGKYSVNDFV